MPPAYAGYVLPILLVVGSYFLGRGLAWWTGTALPRLASKSSSRLDDVIAHASKGPVTLVVTAMGAGAAVLLAPGVPESVADVTKRIVLVIAVVATAVFLSRLLVGILLTYGDRAKLDRTSQTVLRRIAVLFVYVMALLMSLDALGVSITPLLTTLGIAGLAVALALQDTLSNFFAGVYVQADRPVAVGHYVRFEELGIEGYVEEVGWRTTKIRQLANNLVVIPNAKVAQSVVIDYHLPEPRMSLLIAVSVPYGSDWRHVEKLLVEEATRAAGEVPGLLKEPVPFVRFIPGFGESALQFTLIVQVREFVDQYIVQHELRHRILDRLRAEGIEIPFPTREVRVIGPRGTNGVAAEEQAAASAAG